MTMLIAAAVAFGPGPGIGLKRDRRIVVRLQPQCYATRPRGR